MFDDDYGYLTVRGARVLAFFVLNQRTSLWLSEHSHTSLSQGRGNRPNGARFMSGFFKSKSVTLIRMLGLMVTILFFAIFAQLSDLKIAVNAQAFTLPCTITTTGNAWDGVVTFGLLHYNSTAPSTVIESYLVNMKTDGTILNLRRANDSSGDYFEVKYVNQSTILFEGEAGLATHFWNLDTNQTVDFPNVRGYHHDICYNPLNGNFLVLRNYFKNVSGVPVLFDYLEIDTPSGIAVWNWDESSYFPLSWQSKFNETVAYNNGTALDFTHCNSIMWDYQENVTYMNARHLDTFFKINMTNGNVIWGCGKHGNFTLLDANGRVVSSLWYHSHSVQEIAPNYWMMFDNDYNNETNPTNYRSRMLIISLNETSMIAREVWSWAAPTSYYTYFFGKADVLPNGNRLGTFGSYMRPTDNTTGAIIVEVTPQGQVVRTWTFPRYWAIYRVIPGGQVADSFGIYQEPAVIPEFSSVLIVAAATTITTAAVVMLKFENRGKHLSRKKSKY